MIEQLALPPTNDEWSTKMADMASSQAKATEDFTARKDLADREVAAMTQVFITGIAERFAEHCDQQTARFLTKHP